MVSGCRSFGHLTGLEHNKLGTQRVQKDLHITWGLQSLFKNREGAVERPIYLQHREYST